MPKPIQLVEEAIRIYLPVIGTTKVVVSFRNRRGTDSFNDPSGAYDPVTRKLKLWQKATSDPGKAPRLHNGDIKTNSKGVGRYQAGFFSNVFSFGYHNNDKRHPCLKHRGAAYVERFVLEWLEWIKQAEPVGRTYNVHRARRGGESTVVDDWSHGCIVFAIHRQHWDFLLYMGYPEHGLPDDQLVVEPDGGNFHLLIIDVTDIDVDWEGFEFEA